MGRRSSRGARAVLLDRQLDGLDLDHVRRAGDVDGCARRDHDAVAGLDEAGLAGRVDRPLPELLDVGAFGDSQRDDAPLDRHLPPCILVMRETEYGPARPEARDRRCGATAEGWDEDRRRPKRLKFPLLVKSISEEGSVGIAQASIVHDDEKLTQRVEFIHHHNKTAAIAEQYIKGREIYVGVIGNQNIQTYAPWELVMEKLPEGAENIATLKVKWDPAYQERVGLETRAADLTPEQHKTLERLSKRIYRYLFLSGYARMDYRMTEDGQFYLLEANPNPQIAHREDFADSAEHSGVPYDQLLQKIITVGLNYAGRGA